MCIERRNLTLQKQFLMKQTILLSIILTTLLLSCNKPKSDSDIEKWKQEIVNTEKEFADMAKKEGIPKAFISFADDNAVLMRNNALIIGKESLKTSFGKQDQGSGNVSLTWAPDFVDVSASGDLGYTYGKYEYSVTDSLGNVTLDSGIFHTVWKRQSDGSWRFVWD